MRDRGKYPQRRNGRQVVFRGHGGGGPTVSRAGRPRVRRTGESDEQFAARCAQLDAWKAKSKVAHDRRVLAQQPDKIPVAVERVVAPLQKVVAQLVEQVRTTSQDHTSLVDAVRTATEDLRQLAEALFRVAEAWERVGPRPPPSSFVVREPPPPPAPALPPLEGGNFGEWADTSDGASAIDLYRQTLRLNPTAADVLALREILLLCDQVAGAHLGTAGDGYPVLRGVLQRYAADASPVKSALDLQVRLHHFLAKE